MKTALKIVCFYQHRGNPLYLRLIDMLAFSARWALGRSAFLLITDNAELFPSYSTFCLPIDQKKPILRERIRCQAEYLMTTISKEQIIFCDPDILIQGNPSLYFSEAFDVLLLIRPENDQWIQGGVTMARGGNDRAVRFYQETVAVMDELSARNDQTGFAYWLRDIPRFPRRREVKGILFKLVAMDTWHHFYPKGRSEWGGRLIPHTFAHFKGERKGYMAQYYAAWLESLTTPRRAPKRKGL